MGCHNWTYKKLSSFTKEEMNQKLKNLSSDEFRGYVYSTDREEYAQDMLQDSLNTINQFKDELDTISEDDKFFYDYACEHNTIEKWYEVWDEYHNHAALINQMIDEFINDDTKSYNECKDIISKIYLGRDSADFEIINDEMYILLGFNYYFRCWKYADDNIYTYEDMIAYLKNCTENQISFWKDNNRNNPEITGLSPELDNYLKELFKNNDVFVFFG